MTVPLLPGSPRRALAVRFGAELTKAMKARGVGQKTLGSQLGVASSNVASWRVGNNLPRLETAQRLASGLSAPILVEIVLQARTGVCEVDGRSFTNQGGGAKRFCSQECRDVGAKLRSGGGVQGRAIVAERRLRDHMVAVEAMCRGCEPEGLCRDMECALRPVSPLPMASRIDDALPVIRPAGAWGDYARKVASVREVNARRWTPEERERMAARNRDRWAAMSPEERVAAGQRISVGRRRQTA